MKIITYYLLLLVFIALFAGFLVSAQANSMSMTKMISLSAILALYVVAMSLVGEGKTIDERALAHRYLANRAALVAGAAFLSLGVLYQLFTHQLDFWLLGALIVINLVKIMSLVYANHKR